MIECLCFFFLLLLLPSFLLLWLFLFNCFWNKWLIFIFLLISFKLWGEKSYFSSVLVPELAACFGSILDLSHVWLTPLSFFIRFTDMHLVIAVLFFFKRLHWTWLFGIRIPQSLKHFEIIFWATKGSTDTYIYNPAVGGYLLLRAALWRKFKINSWFFSSTKGVFVFFFGRWTTLHSLLSMWWELQCLQEWNQRCIFGLLWHLFARYWDPAMTVSLKHIECYKLFKRLDKQVTESAKEMYVKEKGSTTRTSSFRL